MQQLHLDLSQSATRATILSQLLSAMTDDQRACYDEAIAKLSVPDEHHHHLSDVLMAIESLNADEQATLDMKGVYRILAEAEAAVHEVPVEEIHFHEVGNGSGILNAAKICTAFWVLSPHQVTCTPVQTGCGTIECAHGTLPIPAPATKAILDNGIPLQEQTLEGELCTLTSDAIISHFVTEFSE